VRVLIGIEIGAGFVLYLWCFLRGRPLAIRVTGWLLIPWIAISCTALLGARTPEAMADYERFMFWFWLVPLVPLVVGAVRPVDPGSVWFRYVRPGTDRGSTVQRCPVHRIVLTEGSQECWACGSQVARGGLVSDDLVACPSCGQQTAAGAECQWCDQPLGER
jgi:hypothetical protein